MLFILIRRRKIKTNAPHCILQVLTCLWRLVVRRGEGKEIHVQSQWNNIICAKTVGRVTWSQSLFWQVTIVYSLVIFIEWNNVVIWKGWFMFIFLLFKYHISRRINWHDTRKVIASFKTILLILIRRQWFLTMCVYKLKYEMDI